jgi:hypothetical protein
VSLQTPTTELQHRFLKRVGHSDLCTLPDDHSAVFYEAGMMIDADGAHHAYHPDGRSGLDFLGNAGRPGNWWALVTDNGQANGSPVKQTADDPAPGFFVSTTSLQDASRGRKDPRRYVDAESINFIVLPSNLNLGAKLGDFAVVLRPDRAVHSYAVYGDVGPANQIGEASIALAKALGVPSNPKSGGIGHGVIYVVFTGSAQGWPLSQSEIDQEGEALFTKWGALATARACFPDVLWA